MSWLGRNRRNALFSVFNSKICWRLIPLAIVTLAFLLISLALSGTLASAHADASTSSPRVTMRPVNTDPTHTVTKGYFVITARANTRLSDQVFVTNDGTARGKINIYAVDTTTAQTSGISYGSQHDPRTDVGAWIHLDTTKITLNPGQSQAISFKVSVPKHVRIGTHLGGIIAEVLVPRKATPVDKPQNKASLKILITTQVILGVEVNIPGNAVEQLAATDIAAGGTQGHQSLQVSLQNTGDLMLKPRGSLIVKNSNGQTVQNLPIQMGIILPQTGIDYPVYLQNHALSVGDYTTYLTLNYGHNHTLRFSRTFSVTPEVLRKTFTASNTSITPPAFSDYLGDTPVVIGTFGSVLSIIGLFSWWQRRRLLQEITRLRNNQH